MNDAFPGRVRAAAAAGWWTILIAIIWLLAAWQVSMALLSAQPKWLLTLWGDGELTWPTVHIVMLCFWGVFKLIILLGLFIVIWLTLWSCRLKRLERQEK